MTMTGWFPFATLTTMSTAPIAARTDTTTAAILSERAWTAPTLVGTTLYVRDRHQIMALDLGR